MNLGPTAGTDGQGIPAAASNVMSTVDRDVPQSGLSRRRMSRDAGLDWTPTPYTMRHSHASILSDAGRHIEHLAQRLGHRDSRTTSAYYVHPVTPIVEAGAELDLRSHTG